MVDNRAMGWKDGGDGIEKLGKKMGEGEERLWRYNRDFIYFLWGGGALRDVADGGCSLTVAGEEDQFLVSSTPFPAISCDFLVTQLPPSSSLYSPSYLLSLSFFHF